MSFAANPFGVPLTIKTPYRLVSPTFCARVITQEKLDSKKIWLASIYYLY